MMTVVWFGLGLALVLWFAERLVKATAATALGFDVSSFVVSVVFIGFDPENLAVGAVGAVRGIAGIALGSVIGAAMVAMALAFGLTGLLCPMRFAPPRWRLLVVPWLAVALLWALAADGWLTRLDGVFLLGGYAVAVLWLFYLSRHGVDVEPSGEVAEELGEAEELGAWKAVGLLVLCLAGIVFGSELLVVASERALVSLGLSETAFGMTLLALAVSIEELARELPAALRGRPEISFGNVVGSMLAFFLFNAGLIAVLQPVPVGPDVLDFYLPVCLATLTAVLALVRAGGVGRLGGAALVTLYAVFFAGGYLR